MAVSSVEELSIIRQHDNGLEIAVNENSEFKFSKNGGLSMLEKPPILLY
jgi:hypothetical protein